MENKLCSRGVWDSSIPGISFDENGVSNYAKMFDRLVEAFPRGDKGQADWEQFLEKMKRRGRGRRYDCVVGVSGGTDSSYLLHVLKQSGIRPLAVNLDNGWNSDISVKNIKKMTAALGIDLETYVIDYEEVKDLLRAYMRASLPWVDLPTDIAIKAVLYRVARREGVRFIVRGNDFRSEGFQPREWTYGDGRQLRHIHKKFGGVKLSTFPNYTLWKLIFNGFILGIKSVYPFYFIEYQKKNAQVFLRDNYGWEYYGGHHHENVFTKFNLAYWLPRKFAIDKRRITLSAQVLSGEIGRQEALAALAQPAVPPEEIEREKDYVLKKLEISPPEFASMMSAPNKFYADYPSYYPFMERFTKLARRVIGLFLPYKPMAFYQMEMRKKEGGKTGSRSGKAR